MKRIAILLAVLLLALAALPLGAAAESGEACVSLGLDGLTGGGEGRVYFGAYEGEPVLYRVLALTANDGVTPGAFLLSEYLLGRTIFDTKQSDSNVWMTSVARKRYCAAFCQDAFTDAERGAILKTTYTDARYESPDHRWGACRQVEDTVFFLSVAEAENPAYGFDREKDETRIATEPGGTEGQWWRLRSPSSDSYYDTSVVGPDGRIGRRSADHNRGARPALNLDAAQVLFTVDAARTAEAPEPGLVPVSGMAPEAWKLCVFGAEHGSFSASADADRIGPDGGTVAVAYENAPSGALVSAILTDEAGAALYTGVLAKPDSASGTAQADIPALPEGRYTLHVFSETRSGALQTDTGSRLIALPLQVESASAETPVPETPVPETPVPETPAPGTPEPETPAFTDAAGLLPAGLDARALLLPLCAAAMLILIGIVICLLALGAKRRR